MEPRFEEEYSSREVEAARRAIIDVMQVLASFSDCLVLVGGWVPDLLILDAEVPHVGSIDVDLALDTESSWTVDMPTCLNFYLRRVATNKEREASNW